MPSDGSSNIPPKNKSGGTNAPSESESEASKSDTPTGGTTGGGDDSGQGGGTPSGQSNQAGGGDGQKAQNGSQNSGGNINAAQPLDVEPAAAETDSGGGSSPLVPILIAVAVLAAISIGYFVYRQRRGTGSTVSSPKAG